MDRQEVLESIRENVENENLIKHMLATEAIMCALAIRLGENEAEWAMAGLLHDIDVELIEGDMKAHGRLGADIARDLGASDAIAKAILCHNEIHGIAPKSIMDKALFCADRLTGLITAAVLVRPDKKIVNLELKSVRKRFKEKGFAAGANREQIAKCSDIGLELDDFIEIGVKAMQGIAQDLGL